MDSAMLRAFLQRSDVHGSASDNPVSTSNWEEMGESETFLHHVYYPKTWRNWSKTWEAPAVSLL